MRARVSELESLRRWRLDEEADLGQFVAGLRGGIPASPRMAAGTGFHYALEHAEPGDFALLQAPGFVFHLDIDAELQLPAIRELRSSRAYPVDGGEIIVSGQVDALLARRVEDHKTTAQFDAENYVAGCQWRFYLDIFAADTFRWNVFEIREASDRFIAGLPEDLRALPGRHYVIHETHRLEQHRYPAMHADCAALAADFYRFAKAHLPERFDAPIPQEQAA